jgi:hypothetical protein
MQKSDIPKTAIITPFGLFVSVWMCRLYPSPSLAVWTCRVYIFINAGPECQTVQHPFSLVLEWTKLPMPEAVRYRDRGKQSGTWIFRYQTEIKMPECQCRLHWPWCRCQLWI